MALFLFACVGVPVEGELPDDSAALQPVGDPGTLAVAFQLDTDLVPEMAEPPTGTVLGAVYAETDCTAAGPLDGAVPIYEFVTAPLDLGDGAASAVSATTPPLDPGPVWVLACLDGDANGCDCADPVTVPNSNKVLVVGAAETPIVATLDLLHPC
ncbi:MAG: hypothetical protein V4850_29555 [Myxococcota bacterium]